MLVKEYCFRELYLGLKVAASLDISEPLTDRSVVKQCDTTLQLLTQASQPGAPFQVCHG